MNAKKILCPVVTASLIFCACAQTANKSLPPWTVTVNLTDEAGKPVSGAEVEASYYVPPPPGNREAGESIRGLTDINGVYKVSHPDTGSVGLGLRISKPGYYNSSVGHQFYQSGQFDEKTVIASKNPTFAVVLKKIVKPIPMYAKRLNTHVPATDAAVGFDLMAGDWVVPYGKGISTDIVFTAHIEKHAEKDSDYKLTVSFPNPGDGIQEFSAPPILFPGQGSELRSAHEAAADGYQSEWIQTDNRRAGKPMETNRDENRNYFFRVRTVLDEKGNVKSALYGKIYGDFMQFRYYLNPTPNDRNVEFDPKRNLLAGVKPTEEVAAP